MRALILSGATYADPSTRRLFDHVAAGGVDVVLAMPRHIKHPFAPAEVPETPWPTPGVRLVRLDTWHSHENLTHIVMRGIPRLIRETDPDIIHCVMEPWSITCLQVLGVLRRSRSRTKFGVQPCETKPNQGGVVAREMRKALYRRVVSRCDFFIGWSDRVVRAADTLGLDGQVAGVMPGVGTDLELFRPASLVEKRDLRRELDFHDENGITLIGYVGRFVQEKGLLDLVEAMDRAIQRTTTLRLVLIGNGPLEPTLRAAAAARPWLHVAGGRPRTEIARAIRALDLFVLPSKTTSSWEEQFGLVLAEAMGSAVPVIGSSCGAIPEVIADAGWVFREGDTRALSELITRVASNPDEALAKGQVARDRATARFSNEAIARRLVDTWRSAIGPKGMAEHRG